jgi:hypothetical protein
MHHGAVNMHSPIRFARLGFFVCAFAALPKLALAQKPGSAADSAKACEKAAKDVSKGHPVKKLSDAYLTISSCGATGASALASAIAAYSSETDPTAIDVFMSVVDNWRDSSIMAAAMQLASNPAATPTARVFGVRHLLILSHPYAHYGFAGLTSGETTTGNPDGGSTTVTTCGLLMRGEGTDRIGIPLPANYLTTIAATLSALANSGSTPGVVRNAARCL